MKIEDEYINSDDSYIVYHSTACEELVEVFCRHEFVTGGRGGCMIGPGFYANRFIKQAQKHNYGSYILKAAIKDIHKFLCVDVGAYNEIYGTSYKQEDADKFIGEQFDRVVGPAGTKVKYKEPFKFEVEVDSRPAFVGAAANPKGSAGQYSDEWLKAKQAGFRGLIYRGNWDGESIVAWYAEDVEAIELSIDDGKTWSHRAVDFIKKNSNITAQQLQSELDKLFNEVEQDYKTNKQGNLKDVDKRAIQRALDLRDRIKDFPTDEQKLKHINAHLATIKDPDKRKKRVEAFQHLFKDLADQIK